MHLHAITGPPAGSARPQAAPEAPALPTRTTRTWPSPARPDTSILLDPEDTAPADARATIRRTLETWELFDLTDLAEIIGSEIVTNAITASRDHAPPATVPRQVTLRLTADDQELCIRVWDPDPTLPPRDQPLPADDEEDGRGLFIVNALASGWGSESGRDGGKVVWAALRLGTTPASTSSDLEEEKGQR
jgi:anti-sigma regulatory factor (Ser/Thr protein kinase)